MIEKIFEINEIINGFVWGLYMLVFLIGTGIYEYKNRFVSSKKFY